MRIGVGGYFWYGLDPCDYGSDFRRFGAEGVWVSLRRSFYKKAVRKSSMAVRQVEYLTRPFLSPVLSQQSVRDTYCTYVTSGTQAFVLYDLVCWL
jgi:hypothetical protein